MPFGLWMPAMTMLVAWPRMRGPITVSVTLTTANRSTAAMRSRSGARRCSSRRTVLLKFSDFSTGMPTPNRVPAFTATR